MKKAIITLCHNSLDVTKKFMDCATKELDSSYDLYILDNGSSDDSYKYLESIKQNLKDTQMSMYLLRSEKNLGFAAGNNKLFNYLLDNNSELAKLNHDAQDFYSNVIIINNDTLFTKSALEKLIYVCNSDKKVGATGPISNNVSGIQKININGLTEQNYKQYAEQLVNSKDTHVGEVATLIGFCMCVRLDILKSIGGFDEQFGIGSFEDNDYCLRLRNAGYKLAMVKESLIYHFGSRTVNQFDYMNIMLDNKQKFINKYKADNSKAIASVLLQRNENIKHERIFKSPIEYTITCKDTFKIEQETLKDMADKGAGWCILETEDDYITTIDMQKLSNILLNILPDKDLVKVKVMHFKEDGSVDLTGTNGSDWQSRILRLRKNSDGEYFNFDNVPKDAQTYIYMSITQLKDTNCDKYRMYYLIGKSKISASMIVKDEGKYIRNCLESIKDFVDEIVVVDTGSTDNTKEICKQYTDKVYDYKWKNSFADARNFALSKCSSACDWVFRIDGDEEAPLDLKINMYNTMLNGEADAYLIPIYNFQSDGTKPISTTLRLFKKHKDIQYTGRVHEEIDGCLKQLNYSVLKINSHLLHYGYLKGTQSYKTDFYSKLLMLDYEEDPKNFKTCMNLANHYMHSGKYAIAVDFYKDCIENGGGADPIILHDYAISKYKLLLSRNQEAIKEIKSILEKAKEHINVCYPEQVERFKQNYNIINGMLLKELDK